MFDLRPSVELSMLIVTWLAIAGLVVIAVQLHRRLVRVERLHPGSRSKPYGHLVGRKIADLLDQPELLPAPGVALFLSADCSSCERILGELASPSWAVPTRLLWTDEVPSSSSPSSSVQSSSADLGPSVRVVTHGPEISKKLMIRVTPFALVIDAQGQIVRAAPIGSLEALTDSLPEVPRLQAV